MILTSVEASVYETFKQGLEWTTCEKLLNLNTRNLISICNRLVTFNLLIKIKPKHYTVIPATYDVRSDKEVKRLRKSTFNSSPIPTESNIPYEAAMYIIGHYSLVKRSHLLSKLNESGYKIDRFTLNQFILNNNMDKKRHKENSVRAVG